MSIQFDSWIEINGTEFEKLWKTDKNCSFIHTDDLHFAKTIIHKLKASVIKYYKSDKRMKHGIPPVYKIYMKL